MPLMQCNSCGGRYQSVQADGTQYFHACAPLPPATEHSVTREHPNRRDETLVMHPALYVLEDGTEISYRELPTNGAGAMRKATIRAAGAGALQLDPPPTAPKAK